MSAYLRPGHCEQALAMLAEMPLSILAGGTDFYPARAGKPIQEPILDINALTELRGIADCGGHYRIGALVSWDELLATPLPAYCDGLKRAALEIGGVQIQQAGTLVGNLCTAAATADGIPNLLVLNAAVELRSLREQRTLPLTQFLLGAGHTARRADELVSAVLLPKPSPEAVSGFLKLGIRDYPSTALVSVAGLLTPPRDGSMAVAQFAIVTGSGPAQRLPDLEMTLFGQKPENQLQHYVNAAQLADLQFVDDERASAAYRRAATVVLLRRLIDYLYRSCQ